MRINHRSNDKNTRYKNWALLTRKQVETQLRTINIEFIDNDMKDYEHDYDYNHTKDLKKENLFKIGLNTENF